MNGDAPAPKLELVIANKNYSSWSMRPWMALSVKEIPFEEILLPFDDDAGNPHFLDYSPTKKVPALRHGDLVLWESLTILEYLADLFPERRFWPEDIKERAVARAISSEMHAGFSALRIACPMNIRRAPDPIPVDEDVRKDVERIKEIWRNCLDRSGGPFLFGEFSNADAMYAPMVNRLQTYRLTNDEECSNYCNAMIGLPAWKNWETAARNEPWVLPHVEL